jgi:hypothetical protein
MADLQAIAKKYLSMLPGGSRMELPQVLIEDSPESDWDGITIWNADAPIKGTIKLQEKCMNDPRTVDRLIAHEVCHHWQHMKVWEEGDSAIHRLGHGKSSYWWQAAQIINKIEGDDTFITEKSDASYVSQHPKKFYVMIMKSQRGELGWIWFSRVTENLRLQIESILKSLPVAIVKTNRDAFLSANARLPRVAIPRDDEAMESLLAATYDMYAKRYSAKDLPMALINAQDMD